MKRFLFLTIGSLCLVSLQANAGNGNGETSSTKKTLPVTPPAVQEQKAASTPAEQQSKPFQNKDNAKDSTKKPAAVGLKEQPVKKATVEKEEEENIFDFFIHPFRRLERAI